MKLIGIIFLFVAVAIFANASIPQINLTYCPNLPEIPQKSFLASQVEMSGQSEFHPYLVQGERAAFRETIVLDGNRQAALSGLNIENQISITCGGQSVYGGAYPPENIEVINTPSGQKTEITWNGTFNVPVQEIGKKCWFEASATNRIYSRDNVTFCFINALTPPVFSQEVDTITYDQFLTRKSITTTQDIGLVSAGMAIFAAILTLVLTKFAENRKSRSDELQRIYRKFYDRTDTVIKMNGFARPIDPPSDPLNLFDLTPSEKEEIPNRLMTKITEFEMYYEEYFKTTIALTNQLEKYAFEIARELDSTDVVWPNLMVPDHCEFASPLGGKIGGKSIIRNLFDVFLVEKSAKRAYKELVKRKSYQEYVELWKSKGALSKMLTGTKIAIPNGRLLATKAEKSRKKVLLQAHQLRQELKKKKDANWLEKLIWP